MITTTLAAVGRQLSRTASYIPSVSCCLFRREREREGKREEKTREGGEGEGEGREERRGNLHIRDHPRHRWQTCR